MKRRATATGKGGKAQRRTKLRPISRRISTAHDLRKELREREHELAETRQQLAESLEQQTATSGVLKVISSSPGELQPVFNTILENATRICGAQFGLLFLCDGDTYHTDAMHNAPPALVEARRREPWFRPA